MLFSQSNPRPPSKRSSQSPLRHKPHIPPRCRLCKQPVSHAYVDNPLMYTNWCTSSRYGHHMLHLYVIFVEGFFHTVPNRCALELEAGRLMAGRFKAVLLTPRCAL